MCSASPTPRRSTRERRVAPRPRSGPGRVARLPDRVPRRPHRARRRRDRMCTCRICRSVRAGPWADAVAAFRRPAGRPRHRTARRDDRPRRRLLGGSRCRAGRGSTSCPRPSTSARCAPPTDGRIPIGIVDEPEAQRQSPFVLDLDVVGNVAVIGSGRLGQERTALRTVAVAASAAAAEHPVELSTPSTSPAARSGCSRPCRPSAPSSPAPTSSAITRLLARLDATSPNARRAVRGRGASGVPRRLPAVDRAAGAARHRAARRVRAPSAASTSSAPGGPIFDRLLALASTGRQLRRPSHPDRRPCPVRSRPRSPPPSATRLVLRLAGESEYSAAGVPARRARPTRPPGGARRRARGPDRRAGRRAPTSAAQAAAVEALARAAAGACRAPGDADRAVWARTFRPTALADRPSTVGRRSGVATRRSRPIGLPLDGLFVVTGPFGSGRTTADEDCDPGDPRRGRASGALTAWWPLGGAPLARGRRLGRDCRGTADEAEALAARLATGSKTGLAIGGLVGR